MSDRVVEFRFAVQADTQGLDQFTQQFRKLQNAAQEVGTTLEVADDDLVKFKNEILAAGEASKRTVNSVSATTGAIKALSREATVGSTAFRELTEAATALTRGMRLDNLVAGAQSISNFKARISELRAGMNDLDLATREGRIEYAQLRTELFNVERQFKAITTGYRNVADSARNAAAATRELSNAQRGLTALGTAAPMMAPPVGSRAWVQQQAALSQGPSLARAGMLALPAGDTSLPAVRGGARARLQNFEVASSGAYAGPQFGVNYNQVYGAAPFSQLPPNYFADRRRAIGQGTVARRGIGGSNAFMSAGAISAGAFFGGPEGLIGGLLGTALGGPAAALGGAAIGAQVGIVRKSLGGFATLSADLDKYRIALQGVAGSQEEYQRSLAAIESANQRLNIPIVQGTQSFTQLAAAVVGAGGNIRDAELAFNAVNSAIKATGGNAQDVEGAMRAVTQIFSKGKVSAEELRGQLGERLPGAFQKFADSIGKTPQELDKALKDGTVGLNDLIKFLVSLEQQYSGTAEEIAKSSQDAGARLAAAWEQARLDIGKALQPIGAEIQEGLIKFLESNREEIINFAKGLGAAAKAIFEFTKAYGPLILETGKFLLIFKGVQVANGLAAASFVKLNTAMVASGGTMGLLRARTTALAASLGTLAKIGIVTVGVNYVATGAARDMGSLNEVRDLSQRNARGGAAALFDGSDQETVAQAQATARRTLAAIEAERERINNPLARGLNFLVPALTGGDQNIRRRVLDEREKAARAILGLDANSFPGRRDPYVPSVFQQPDGQSGSGSETDKAARDAERLAAEQRRLAEANAQFRRRLEEQLFEFQMQLDEKRYANLRRLAELTQRNAINSLPQRQRRAAQIGAELNSGLWDEYGQVRDAQMSVARARQRLTAAKQFQGAISAFPVPAAGGGAVMGAGSTTGERVVQAAQRNLGLLAGVSEQCANVIRKLFQEVGVAIGVTKETWDLSEQRGLPQGAGFANSFFGSDIGQRINRREDLRPGDLVGFERTYGNWGSGVQTHVGLYAGGGMMFDHSTRGGLVRRPVDTFGGKFMYGVRPYAYGGGRPAGGAAVRAEISGERAEFGVEEAQVTLQQAEALLKEAQEFSKKAIAEAGKAAVLSALQPIRDRIEVQREETETLQLRNRLLLEGVSPEIIDFEERMLDLRREQAAELTQFNTLLTDANAKLAEAQKTGDPTRIAVAAERAERLREIIAQLPAEYEKLAGSAREFLAESQRMEEPWERLQLAIINVKQELEDLQDPVNQIQSLANGIGDAFGSSFRSIITGSSSVKEAMGNLFKDIAGQFADMAASIVAKAIEAQILGGAQSNSGIGGFLFGGLGGLFGGAFGGGAGAISPFTSGLNFLGGASPLPLNFNATGGVFGPAQPFARGGVVNNITPFRFASGGVMRQGVMGEAGPEAILPLRRTRSGNLGVIAADGGSQRGSSVTSVTVNVDAKGSSVQGDDERSRGLGKAISDAVQAELVRQQRPGGLLDSSRKR